jgi:hypothetical protein
MAFEDLLKSFIPSLPVEQYGLLYSFFFPFLLIFAVLFAALEVVNIFSRKINLVLALVFTFLTFPTGTFVWFATILPTYGAIVAVGTFAALFFFGVIRWGLSRGKDIYMEHRPAEDRLWGLRKKHDKLFKKFMEARERGDDRLAAKLREDLKELESEIVYEQEKMKRES